LKNSNKTILVAPLHWGLGHAARCIPLIHALLEKDYNILLGSDGAALDLLRKEFPELPSIELPSYNITYPKKANFFKIKLLFKLPHIKKAMEMEKKVVKQLIKEGIIQGIISDNRMGVRSKKVPSVFITHQVTVLSGNTSFFSSKMHQKIIKKFDACWVPDLKDEPNLSGKLGHPKDIDFALTYIGPLSRLRPLALEPKYDCLILLSGPEPQRTLLEMKLMKEFSGSNLKVLMVRGVVEAEVKTYQKANLTIVNFLTSQSLEQVINESKLIVARSGYTTLMDLAALEKKAFFIPTPGQFEQEYLAKQLKKKGIAPFCKQDQFKLEKIEEVNGYQGLKAFQFKPCYKELFALFEGE